MWRLNSNMKTAVAQKFVSRCRGDNPSYTERDGQGNLRWKIPCTPLRGNTNDIYYVPTVYVYRLFHQYVRIKRRQKSPGPIFDATKHSARLVYVFAPNQ